MSESKENVKRIWPKVALALLVIYTLSLAVATADEIFNLGLFPTKLERMIGKAIKNLKSPDSEVQFQAKKEIELYGDFAIPQLIKALDAPEIKHQALELLKTVSGKNLGQDPKAWRDWYKKHKHEF